MAYFPLFVELKNKIVVVFGGGPVAYRKIKTLLNFEPQIKVISPKFCQELKEVSDKITLIEGSYDDKYLKDAFLVIAATDAEFINKEIVNVCNEKGTNVNSANQNQEGFLFPAVVKRGAVIVGITSSGGSPSLSRKLKKDIKELIPDFYEKVSDQLLNYRNFINSTVKDESKRKKIHKELLILALQREGDIKEIDVLKIIDKY